MFHVGGLGWALVGLHRGAHDRRGVDLADRARGAAASRAGHACVPRAHAAPGLCDVAGSEGPDLRVVVYGAAPMSAATRTAVMETFDCALVHVYGMTETTARSPSTSSPTMTLRLTSLCRTAVPLGRADHPRPRNIHGVARRSSGEIWTRSAQNTPAMPATRSPRSDSSRWTVGCALATSATSTTRAGLRYRSAQGADHHRW